MIATGYIVEQSVLGAWSLLLFVFYAIQLKQDVYIERIVNIQDGAQTNSIVFRRTKSLGYTAYIFHLGGTLGSLILVIRSIDPFPALGILPFVATDLLSHIGIAVLLNTLFEGIGAIASKVYYKLNLPIDENFLQRWIRRLSYVTMFVAIITWIIENFVSSQLMYSAGAYFLYGTIIQWIILILFSRMIRIFESQLGPNSPLIKDNSLRESIRKLKWIQFLFLFINTLLTIYQIYVFAGQIRNRTTRDELDIDSENYKPISAPLYLTQIVGYTILLWFCYVPSKKAGNQVGLSEVSEATRTAYLANASAGERQILEERKVTEIREVVVKFKDHELDPKIKVLDTEELQRTTVNRQLSGEASDPVSLQDIHLKYQQNGSVRSNASSDYQPIDPQELQRLMRIIEQQEQAEKEGKLDELLAQQERDLKVTQALYASRGDDTQDTNSGFDNDRDFLSYQIQAMKEREYYERVRHSANEQLTKHTGQALRQAMQNIDQSSDSGLSSVPPTPPPFLEDYQEYPMPASQKSMRKEKDASTRVLFDIPDDETLGQSSSSSDLNRPQKSKIPIKKR